MNVLLVIGRMQEGSTAFKAAREIAKKDRLIFVFAYGGCRHATNQGLVRSLDFADGVFCLEPHFRSEGAGDMMAEGVEPIDYGGWVRLIETADRIVSWF